ncbi:MAG: cation transporter [Acetobacteraceae bacterium]|nr:cation transporter [Acetobacteraceae bacterium]
MRRSESIALGSIGVGCVVLGLKAAAWRLTHSAAFYSDALETTVNVLASTIAFYAVRLASKPADAEHPYGHQKVEFFAAVIEGVLIVLAALSIFGKAWLDFIQPHPLNLPVRGILFSALATLLNAGWAVVLLRTGRSIRSAALVGDGRHLLADVTTSLGVITGVGLVALTGILVIDPAVAVAAGVYVLWSGLGMISSSVGGLMDTAPDPVIVQRIRELLSESASGALEAHDLRTRYAGRLTYLEFHLVVPGNMTVSEAHAICDRIEGRLKNEMEYLVITIHVEPEEKAKQHGVPIL